MATKFFFKPHAIFCMVIMLLPVTALAVAPEISAASGSMKEGQVITLSGSNFTAKANAKPLLFWSADGGLNPSPLGRTTAWEGTFNGEIVDRNKPGVAIAEGSNKSLRHDYGASEGAILSRVHFNSDDLYVWRKRYDDFDASKDFAIRTRYKNVKRIIGVGDIVPGMFMSTADKTIWGKVIKNEVARDGKGTAYYSNAYGNLTDTKLARSVLNGATLLFYDESDTDLKNPLMEALLDEGQGIFQTFNHKTIRLWGEYGSAINNTYIGLAPLGIVVNEYTQDKTFWGAEWSNEIFSATRRWVVEEYQYRSSNVDQIDGILLYWQDRTQAWKDHKFRFRTTAYPKKYSDLYQGQVSNGAQLLSYEYFDALYVDESWHRVMICAESTWSSCKQPEVVIPTAWSDSQIKVNLRLGGLKDKVNFYFYVVNGLGEANEKGFASCPQCPLPPSVK